VSDVNVFIKQKLFSSVIPMPHHNAFSAMSYKKIESIIDSTSDLYRNNYKAFRTVLTGYYERLNETVNHSNTKAIEKHKQRGKLLARERVNLLIDEGTPFFELSTMAAIDQYKNNFPSAGIITGIGLINKKPAVIVANDATVKGGTYIRETIKKHIRAQEIAAQNHLPCVYLVDSGGIFLPQQAEVFPDRFDFGRIFFNQARLSASGIPQISVVMGSCTAGGAYIPAMSDETIIVRNQGTIFIGGPPLVKAATGEEVTAEELGGGEVHTQISGVADYLAENDADALQICRNIFETLNSKEIEQLSDNIREPVYDGEELYGLIPDDLKKNINPYELIARIADASAFHEFKKEYGKTLVTGSIKLYGKEVGVIANNGFLNSESSLKGAHFIELCEFRSIPLLFLQNITGFIVGKTHEHKGIARDGAKLIHAVSNARVPKITLVFGGSFGAGNYAMSGRAFEPNFLLMWPNSKISVMGGSQAQQVLEAIGARESGLIEQFEKESMVYFSTSRLWDDGIIDPKDTRKVLGLLFSVTEPKPDKENKFGIFRM
jgi:3-methylcrotonyl-CoA carboxylase beta subunit